MENQNEDKKKLKVFTAFSGYDSQCMALERLKEEFPDFDYELVGWSEIDEPAILSHNAVFPEYADRNYGDISKINWAEVPDFDLFTYSSPCQDFSICGKQRGGVEGSGTRSSLLWECKKTIEAKKPKFCILENVKALVSDKFKVLFNKWIETVNSMGYVSSWRIVNSADFGVPQGRERVFLVSIRVDDGDVAAAQYNWPVELERTKEIEDYLGDTSEEILEACLNPNIIPPFLDLLEHAGEDFEKNTVVHKDIAGEWTENRDKINQEAEQKLKERKSKSEYDSANLFDEAV